MQGRIPGRARGGAGFTLVEVLIATVMAAITLLGLFAMLDAVTRSSANDQERGSAQVEQSAAVHRIVQELEETYEFNAPTGVTKANYVDVDAWVAVPGSSQQKKRIVFDCEISSPVPGERECVRYETATSDSTSYTSLEKDTGAKSKVVLPRLVNGTTSSPVFELETRSGATRPLFGTVTVETPASGERVSYSGAHSYQYELTLHDAFFMRNLDLSE